MSITRSHENAIVVTPATLKHQLVTRLHTLVSQSGGKYFPKDDEGIPTQVEVVNGIYIYGIQVKGRNVYFMGVPSDEHIAIGADDELYSYDANDFYIEQIWDVYLGCEPLYKMKHYNYGEIEFN